MVADAAGQPYRFSGTAIDITSRKTAEEQRLLLMEELSHRVKNTFAMVQSLAAQTLRGTDPAVLQTLQSRLTALSGAHDILLQTGWRSMTMSAVMEQVLRLEAEADRFVVEGEDFELNADAALSLSLLVHELATNAVKYGALSNDAGRVRINWQLEDETFWFRWNEEGGPAAKSPTRRGFGSRLIDMGIRGSRNAQIAYGEDGFNASFQAPRTTVVAEESGKSSDR